MKCMICGSKKIKGECQYINGEYYHNICIERLTKENQELKKENEEYKRLGFKHLNDKCNKLENQQKEFVEYLENEIKSWTEALNNEHDYELVQEFAFKCNIYEEILSRYKEIIGGKDE